MGRFERERNQPPGRLAPCLIVMVVMAVIVIVIALGPALSLMMMVVLVAILAAFQERLLALLFRRELHQFHRRDLLLVGFHEFKREVHDLVLIDRGAQLIHGLRILAVELDDLPLLPRELTGAFHDSTAQFVVPDADLVHIADLGEDEAKANAPPGQIAILLASLFLGCALSFEAPLGLLKLAGDVAPDCLELAFYK